MATKNNAATARTETKQGDALPEEGNRELENNVRAKHEQEERAHCQDPDLYVPTAQQVTDDMVLGMELIANAFRSENERARTRIDNETGEELEERTVVNTLGFQQGRVLGGIIWSISNAIAWLHDSRNDYGSVSLMTDLRKTLHRQERGGVVDDALNSINGALERLDQTEAELNLRRIVAVETYERITGRAYVAPGTKREAKVTAIAKPEEVVSPAVAKARARLAAAARS